MFISSSNNEFTHSRHENTTTGVSNTNMASPQQQNNNKNNNSIFASKTSKLKKEPGYLQGNNIVKKE